MIVEVTLSGATARRTSGTRILCRHRRFVYQYGRVLEKKKPGSSNCVLFVCMVLSLEIKDLKLFALPKLVVPAEKVPRMEPGVISDLV